MSEITVTSDLAKQLQTAVGKAQQAFTTVASQDELKITGKVPEQALQAFSTIQNSRSAVRQHIAVMQDCLLPCSAEIVATATAYLQHVVEEPARAKQLAASGQLSQHCKQLACALGLVQEGFEALGSDLLDLQDKLQDAERKVLLNLQAAQAHVNKKLARRNVQQEAAPAATGVGAALLAGAAALIIFPPAILLAPAAGYLAGAAAEDITDDAKTRAEQQLARTDKIADHCKHINTQLQHALDCATATSCVAQLAGFFNSLAGAADRASRTAARVEERVDTQDRAFEALNKVLARQAETVVASGRCFVAAVRQLPATSNSKAAVGGGLLKPAYRRVQLEAERLSGLQRAIGC